MRTRPSCALLAEPHHGLAEGVRSLLATVFEAVVMVSEQVSLLEAVGKLAPALLVVDLSLTRPDVGRLLRQLRSQCPGLKVIILSVHDEMSVAQSVIDAGADGFVIKRDIAAEFLPAVEAALRSPRCRA